MEKSFQDLIALKKEEIENKKNENKPIDKTKYYTEEEAIHKIYKVLLEKAKIPKEYQNCSFSNFDINFIPENKDKVAELKDFALNYDKNYDKLKSYQSVLLYSEKNGCGKTHLAVSMGKLILWGYAKVLYKREPFKYNVRGVISNSLQHLYSPVFFMSEKKYIWCRKRFYTDNQDIINYVAECEKALMNSRIIIYDDLFRSRDTDFFFEELEGIISQRYDEKKAFIFTTNTNILTIGHTNSELNPFKGRIAQGNYLLSRIKKMCGDYLYKFADYKDYRSEGFK